LTSRNESYRYLFFVWTRQHAIDHLVESTVSSHGDKSTVVVNLKIESLVERVEVVFAHNNLVHHVLLVKHGLNFPRLVAADVFVVDNGDWLAIRLGHFYFALANQIKSFK